MVVVGAAGAKVALECDGDRHHPPEDLNRDLDRQRMLERLGWRFVRVRGSEFFRDPEGAMRRIRRRLTELGVEPIGADASPDREVGSDEVRERVVRRAEALRREWSAEDQLEDAATVTPELELAVPALISNSARTPQLPGFNGHSASAAVLAAIREARVPVARAEIIERSGIAPDEWIAAIRRLIQDGEVIMQGTKCGARYVLTAATVPDVEAGGNA